MANKLYREEDIVRLAKAINSYSGESEALRLRDMPDAVVEISNIAISLIDRSLKKLVIPQSVSFIGQYAFSGFGRCLIFDFTKHTSVPELASANAFGQLNAAAKILVPADLYYDWINSPVWSELTEYIVPPSSEGLYFESYDGKKYTVMGRGSCYDAFIVIPDSYNGCPVTEIDGTMFQYDDELEAVYLSKNITHIYASPFSGCYNLKKIYMLGVTDMVSITMCEMSALKYVLFGKNISFLGGAAFSGSGTGAFYDFSACTSIPSLDSYGAGSEFGTSPVIGVPAALYDEWIAATNWSLYASNIVAVYKAPEILDPGYDSEGLTFDYGDEWGGSENQYTVSGRGTCTDSVVVIPDHYNGPQGDYEVTGIKMEAFWYDSDLTEIYLPETINGMNSGAMNACSNLKKIYMPGVKQIASLQFMELSSLEYVRFGEDLYYIGEGSFAIDVVNAVFDFSACKAVPQLEGYDYSQFGTSPIIYVPKKLYSEWIAASNWSKYADFIYPAK